jgi:hypothetical protein
MHVHHAPAGCEARIYLCAGLTMWPVACVCSRTAWFSTTKYSPFSTRSGYAFLLLEMPEPPPRDTGAQEQSTNACPVALRSRTALHGPHACRQLQEHCSAALTPTPQLWELLPQTPPFQPAGIAARRHLLVSLPQLRRSSHASPGLGAVMPWSAQHCVCLWQARSALCVLLASSHACGMV